MDGCSPSTGSVSHISPYSQGQHSSDKLDLDAFKLPNNCGSKALYMKLSPILLNLSSTFCNNLNHWNLSSDTVIHRNMKHLKSILTVIGCSVDPEFYTRQCFRHEYHRRSWLVYLLPSNWKKNQLSEVTCLPSFKNYSF